MILSPRARIKQTARASRLQQCSVLDHPRPCWGQPVLTMNEVSQLEMVARQHMHIGKILKTAFILTAIIAAGAVMVNG